MVDQPASVTMDYAAFRKAFPATRCLQHFSSEERAMRAASHRLQHRARQAVGEYYYVHPMLPGRAYASAKLATEAAFGVYVRSGAAS